MLNFFQELSWKIGKLYLSRHLVIAALLASSFDFFWGGINSNSNSWSEGGVFYLSVLSRLHRHSVTQILDEAFDSDPAVANEDDHWHCWEPRGIPSDLQNRWFLGHLLFCMRTWQEFGNPFSAVQKPMSAFKILHHLLGRVDGALRDEHYFVCLRSHNLC